MTETINNNRKFNFKGQIIEELDDYDFRPPFMSPKPVSPKRSQQVAVSILGKRKYQDAFDDDTFDDVRYGQHISSNFFETNVGHCVTQKESEILDWCEHYLANKNIKINPQHSTTPLTTSHKLPKSYTPEEQKEILDWCDYYLANKNLFNV